MKRRQENRKQEGKEKGDVGKPEMTMGHTF